MFLVYRGYISKIKGRYIGHPGYSGGQVENPTYEQVSGGDTGHVESIKIDFDPAQISFETLLERIFCHARPDPKKPAGPRHWPAISVTVFYMDDGAKTGLWKILFINWMRTILTASLWQPKLKSLKSFIRPKAITKIIITTTKICLIAR